MNNKPIRYIALGDSYTIGEGAELNEAWPPILTSNLNNAGVAIELIANPSVTGWTTQDLIEKELPVFDSLEVDFCTLLIGVNDWVQEITKAQFSSNLKHILDHVQKGLNNPNNIVLITIPDFGITPNGQDFSKGRNISEGLQEFNFIIKAEAKKRNLTLTDIYPISRRMQTESNLVAKDGIHGSADMYRIWEKLIYPDTYKVLTDKP